MIIKSKSRALGQKVQRLMSIPQPIAMKIAKMLVYGEELKREIEREYETINASSHTVWDKYPKDKYPKDKYPKESEMKTYLVYVDGIEMPGLIRAANQNAAEKKAKNKYPYKNVSVEYTEV